VPAPIRETPSRPEHNGSPRTLPLCELQAGDRGRLHATELSCEDCELLQAMGLTDRCELRVCRGGAPCIVQVESTRLGLSRSMSRRIMVSIDASAR
jgi:Fe2+ transport system protein FeoA